MDAGVVRPKDTPDSWRPELPTCDEKVGQPSREEQEKDSIFESLILLNTQIVLLQILRLT